jgi:hypothetical protein
MFREYDPKDVTARLLAMIGEPYEKPDGCIKFVRRALWEFGVEIEGTKAGAFRDAKKFKRLEKGELGTVIVWNDMSFEDFHVGLMLDGRWALQSSVVTNGVARVEITRSPWASAFRGFYRPKKLWL